MLNAFIAIGLCTFVLSAVAEFLDHRHYVKCTNELIAAGVLPKDYLERRPGTHGDDDACRLKREAKERGEHIVP